MNTRRFSPSALCITDVGSTTTKAVLFENAGGWRLVRAEAPTTVERPHEDVMVGVLAALRALERKAGRRLLRDEKCEVPYLSTSSAGGGLAMVVTGLVRELTSRSAERVALGAGAILLDVLALDDGRTPYEKIEALRRLRPDMVLLAGGFDGDALSGPVFLAELLREAALRPKLSASARLPVIYAGNFHARELVRGTLGADFAFHPVANLRPSGNREDLEPARDAIHDLFMTHVMSQAPGYDALKEHVSAPVMPTPGAFARILELATAPAAAAGAGPLPGRGIAPLAERILAIDIGGATTDVFTASQGRVIRTVSANLGMSYSILNVARRGGSPAILELIDPLLFAGADAETRLWDEIGEKYLRPTSLPAAGLQAAIEQAVAAVAVRLAVEDHLQVLRGERVSRDREELSIRHLLTGRSRRRGAGHAGLSLAGYNLVIGSGGILSHTPREVAARILRNALRPPRSLAMAVDRAFVLPHLGVLAGLAPELALQLFAELALVRLGARDPRADGRGDRDGSGDSGGSRDPDGNREANGNGEPRRREERDAPVRAGEIVLRRELAIGGEVFVSPGQRVAADTLIARSQRRFLRPFFLDVAQQLACSPGEVAQHLLTRVGAEITEGDVVARRRAHALRTMEVRTAVAGRIERMLPSGMLVIRERPEQAQQLVAVPVARDLRLRPDEIRRHMRVTPGQLVERGQWLAVVVRSGLPAARSASTARGKVRDIDYGSGVVTIDPLPETLDVLAWMPGTVREVSEKGAVTAAPGVEITGLWGQGGEASGALAWEEPIAGRVLVRDFADRGDLERAAAVGISGLITAGLHLRDVLAVAPRYSIVVTGGFGERGMDPQVRAALVAHGERMALLDGRTEMRVGVRRPRVILPRDEEPARPSA